MRKSKLDLGLRTAVLGLALIVGACGGDAPTGPSTTSPGASQPGTVDPALVGTWAGPIEGPTIPGGGTFTMVLDASGTLQMSVVYQGTTNSNPGTWRVSGSEFTARSGDTSFFAAVSTNSMQGTWSRPNGDRGGFSASKQ